MNKAAHGHGSRAAKLQVEGLTKIYGGRPEEALRLLASGKTSKEILATTQQVVAVSNVSFSVEQGEIFTIMGLSGSGKSTLVRCLNRLIEASAGSVRIDGQDLLAGSQADLRSVRRNKIAMVFQNFALLPHKSVAENVEFGLMLRGEPPAARREKALRTLAQVGLSDWAHRYPDNLSGGMKQRVGLARALASDPDILLMDEPFSALDPLIRSDLQEELLRLQREIRKTIIFITHDFHEAVRLSDRLAVMRDGAFVQVGTAHDIVLRPVDDYVATFARELDRSRMLCAGDLAYKRVPIVGAEMPVEAAHDRVVSEGHVHAVVVDADRAPIGYVSLRDIKAALAGEKARTLADVRREPVLSAPATAPLSGLFGLFGGRAPLVVIDGTGKAQGAVDASDVLQQLHLVAQQGNSDLPDHAPSRSARPGQEK